MELKGKTALVTGAGKRVGKEIALTLARRGCHIIVHYNKSRYEAELTVGEIQGLGVQAVAVQAEFAQPEQVRALASQAVDLFGGVDVLVNSASIYGRKAFANLTEQDWDEHLSVNLKSVFLLCKILGDWMLARSGGKIINIADWAGIRPYRNYLPYCVSKAGVIALTHGLAKELAPKITVNAIAPGPVLPPDDFTEDDLAKVVAKTPLGRFGSPEDVASAVLFLLEGSDFITGAILPVDGGRLIA